MSYPFSPRGAVVFSIGRSYIIEKLIIGEMISDNAKIQEIIETMKTIPIEENADFMDEVEEIHQLLKQDLLNTSDLKIY